MYSKFNDINSANVLNFGTSDPTIGTLAVIDGKQELHETVLANGMGVMTIQKCAKNASSGQNTLVHFGLNLSRTYDSGDILTGVVYASPPNATVVLSGGETVGTSLIVTVTFSDTDEIELEFQTDNKVFVSSTVGTINDLSISFNGVVIIPYPRT